MAGRYRNHHQSLIKAAEATESMVCWKYVVVIVVVVESMEDVNHSGYIVWSIVDHAASCQQQNIQQISDQSQGTELTMLYSPSPSSLPRPSLQVTCCGSRPLRVWHPHPVPSTEARQPIQSRKVKREIYSEFNCNDYELRTSLAKDIEAQMSIVTQFTRRFGPI